MPAARQKVHTRQLSQICRLQNASGNQMRIGVTNGITVQQAGIRIADSGLLFMSGMTPVSLFWVCLATPCSTMVKILLFLGYYMALAGREKRGSDVYPQSTEPSSSIVSRYPPACSTAPSGKTRPKSPSRSPIRRATRTRCRYSPWGRRIRWQARRAGSDR